MERDLPQNQPRIEALANKGLIDQPMKWLLASFDCYAEVKEGTPGNDSELVGKEMLDGYVPTASQRQILFVSGLQKAFFYYSDAIS